MLPHNQPQNPDQSNTKRKFEPLWRRLSTSQFESKDHQIYTPRKSGISSINLRLYLIIKNFKLYEQVLLHPALNDEKFI